MKQLENSILSVSKNFMKQVDQWKELTLLDHLRFIEETMLAFVEKRIRIYNADNMRDKRKEAEKDIKLLEKGWKEKWISD